MKYTEVLYNKPGDFVFNVLGNITKVKVTCISRDEADYTILKDSWAYEANLKLVNINSSSLGNIVSKALKSSDITFEIADFQNTPNGRGYGVSRLCPL